MVGEFLKHLLLGPPNFLRLIQENILVFRNLCKNTCREQRFVRKIDLHLFFDQKFGDPVWCFDQGFDFFRGSNFSSVGESFPACIAQHEKAFTSSLFCFISLNGAIYYILNSTRIVLVATVFVYVAGNMPNNLFGPLRSMQVVKRMCCSVLSQWKDCRSDPEGWQTAESSDCSLSDYTEQQEDNVQ